LAWPRWATTVRRTTCWAITRAELGGLLTDAGFTDVTWPDTAFFQPVLSAATG